MVPEWIYLLQTEYSVPPKHGTLRVVLETLCYFLFYANNYAVMKESGLLTVVT